MRNIVLLSLLVIYSPTGFAQQQPNFEDEQRLRRLETGELDLKVRLTHSELVRLSRRMNRRYRRIKPNKASSDLARYTFVADYFGIVLFEKQLQEIKIPDNFLKGEKGSVVMPVDIVSKKTLQKFEEAIKRFSPENAKTTDEAKQFKRTQAIIRQLRSWSRQVSFEEAVALHRKHQTGAYSFKVSLKQRTLHLPSETIRFSAAIIITRLATCIGVSPSAILLNQMTFDTGKGIGEFYKDPTCVNEVADMFKNPIFYYGFTAFVLGSAAGNAGLMKVTRALERINPATQKYTTGFIKNYIPHLSLAIGFISDHMLKKYVENEAINLCATKSIGRSIARPFDLAINAARDGLNQIIEEDGEKYEKIPLDKLWSGPACKEAGRVIKSDEFKTDEIGLGVYGLVTTAIALSQVTKGLNKVQKAKKVQEVIKAAKGIKNISLVFSLAGGPVGILIKGIVHMAAFLDIFEYINPFLTEAAHLGALDPLPFMQGVEPKLDKKTQDLRDKAHKIIPTDLSLNEQEQEPEHPSGFTEAGDVPESTRLPLAAELETFAAYASAWRSKYVLKDFYLSLSRWRSKVTSFTNNYFVSMEQVEALTRSREIYLTGRSEFIDLQNEILRRNNVALLREAHPLPADIDLVLNRIKNEIKKETEIEEYWSYLRDDGSSPYHWWVSQNLYNIQNNQKVFASSLISKPFSGLALSDQDGSGFNKGSLTELINDIIYFMHSEEGLLVNTPWKQNENEPDFLVSERVETFGFPWEISRLPQDFKTIEFLLQLGSAQLNLQIDGNKNLNIDGIRPLYFRTKAQENIAIALLLFKDWLPYISGPFERRSGQYAEANEYRLNPRGMSPDTYQMWKYLTDYLKGYAPMFDKEKIYLDSNWTNLGKREKTAEDTQFKQFSHRNQTKRLHEFVLTQLICGKTKSLADITGPFSRVGLHFQFPHLGGDDHCKGLFQEIRVEKGVYGSPIRNIFFVEEQGDINRYIGLHNYYIRTPKDDSNPLLFDTERQAKNWWNDEVRPESLDVLAGMEQEYPKIVEKQFAPLLTYSEPNDWWFSKLLRWIPWVDSGEKQQVIKPPSTRSLTLSLINEFKLYTYTLSRVLADDEYKQLKPSLKEFGQCIVDLMDSLQGKKYSVVKSQCNEAFINVKSFLIRREGKYPEPEDQDHLKGIAEDELSPEQIKDRILLVVEERLNSLIEETQLYDELVNKTINFDLTQGEIE